MCTTLPGVHVHVHLYEDFLEYSLWAITVQNIGEKTNVVTILVWSGDYILWYCKVLRDAAVHSCTYIS